MHSLRRFSLWLICLLLFAPAPSATRAGVGAPFQATNTDAGVALRWSAPDPTGWRELRLNGMLVPMQLVTVRLRGSTTPIPQLHHVESTLWNGVIPSAAAPQPQTLDGRPRPELATIEPARLPSAPLYILREGEQNGIRTAVLAVSQLFDSGDGPRLLTAIESLVPAAVLDDGSPAFPARLGATPAAAPAPGPSNPVALTALARVQVSVEGIQRLTGTALTAAGIDPAGLDPARLQIIRGGAEVAAELVGMGDGRFDPGDEVRFFAAAPGDRWNTTTTYWLVQGSAPGLRMQSRSAIPAPGALQESTIAIERGRWREGHIYDTTMPGPRGDYWYAADLKIDPSSVASEVTFTAVLTPALPLATGQLSLTVEGAAYTSAVRQLIVRGSSASQSQSWGGTGAWTRVYMLAENPAAVVLALQRGVAPHGIEIQALQFERPVQLTLGGRGAIVEGRPGRWRYRVVGAAADRVLYDVSDPGMPVRLTIPAGADFSFDDESARRYVITGPGALVDPVIIRHSPVDLAAPLNASALYIAPAEFHAALNPLLVHRQGQGYLTRVVDVQAIHDAWSDGQVDPGAIRSFLRYARDTWPTPPQGVTLVGDGTADPWNYGGRNNTNYIPPFMAHVDPWLGETACESCYAQLDGAEPLSDPLPDLPLGRLPVKNAQELSALVGKIVGYETGPIEPSWQSRMIVVADNFREPDGQADSAGDFAAFGDQITALAPPGIEIRRMYYDPWPGRPAEPWREAGALAARQRAMTLMSDGAALVTYLGHSSQFQWAVTDPSASPSYLLGLYDADQLSNSGRLAIIRGMTCLTAAFQTPAFSGTTIDERLLLQPGGAVAIWGPTGFGVAHGHDALVRGFDQALWASYAARPTVGRLVLAGYTELYGSEPCCQDTIWTFALLGDPLTGVRVVPAQRVMLPAVLR